MSAPVDCTVAVQPDCYADLADDTGGPVQSASRAESLAAAYNDGRMPTHQVGLGQKPGASGEHYIPFSPLDAPIFAYFSNLGLAASYDPIENARRVQEFLDFIGSSKGPEVAEFRAKYAQHLIDTYVLDAAAFNNPERRDAAAGLAANLMGGDASRPEIAVRVLWRYNPAQRQTIIECAARSNGIYGAEYLQPLAADRYINVRDVRVPNGLALMMDAIALARSHQSDELAVELVRLATKCPNLFKGFGGKDHIDALTLIFANHAKAVLDVLTKYENRYIGSVGQTRLHQYMLNASELGALFKLTLFNKDCTYAKLLQNKIVDYARDLANVINLPGPNGEQMGRMAMLQASITDGVIQGYEQLAADKARQKEILGFFIDLAFAAIPLSKLTSAGIERALKDVFGDNERLRTVLKTPLEQMVNKTTGKLTEQGRRSILDCVSGPEGDLALATYAANQLNQGFMNQLSEQDYDRELVHTNYNVITNGIATIRDKK